MQCPLHALKSNKQCWAFGQLSYGRKYIQFAPLAWNFQGLE